MELALFDVHSKQQFIYSSPRLKEIIGASSLIKLVSSWVDKAIRDIIPEASSDSWVTSSSGRVIIIVENKDQARRIISEVTRRAASDAPGMDVSGVHVSLKTNCLQQDDLNRLNAAAARYELQRTPPLARFTRIPFLAAASDSSFPACGLFEKAGFDSLSALVAKPEFNGLSFSSIVKRRAADSARDAFLDEAKQEYVLLEDDELLARDPTKLQDFHQGENDGRTSINDRLSKVAVIHIDGNSVGNAMRHLDKVIRRIPADELKRFIGCDMSNSDSLRKFMNATSIRLDLAVRQAFVAASNDVAQLARDDAEASGDSNTIIPVVPVILGGDDVTVITCGDYALPFVTRYVEHYEAETETDGILKYLSDPGGAPGPMTAGAGVAIVRRNFPFHIAYDLAEGLVREAKKIGKRTSPPRSSLSFHVLFDTTVLDSEAILKSYSSFTKRPYFLHSATPTDETTSDHPTWQEVIDQVKALRGFFEADDDSSAASQKVLRDSSETDDASNAASQEAPVPTFPRTRAARIRKLLSERAVANAMGNTRLADENYRRVQREWANAKEHYSAACERIGSPEALFDLMELVDLLPPAHIRQQSSPPAAIQSVETAHTSPTPDNHSEVNE